ncbi:MAG: flagellar biosynthetic protein FliP [Candidatus Dadabacteria bacterium]|nr:MAG: flagellar biosynthetic protein FliP [Candidatus Dadabacteria bacterium]
MATAANPIWLVIAALALALLPVLVGVATSYLKISIVLGMFRSGLGAQQVPGNMVVMGLSIAMSLYILSPVIEASFYAAGKSPLPSLADAPSYSELKRLSPIVKPWIAFLKKHSGKRELQAVREFALDGNGREKENKVSDNPLSLLVAFMLTELKEAFSMGFVILLPFLVIDMVVANILVGMGMFMVSPVMVALPLKLLLFIMCDGWILLMKGLIESYV